MEQQLASFARQCANTELDADYIRNVTSPNFFRNFWVRNMALERGIYNQIIDTTVEMANRVGVADIVRRLVENLKDESEPYRRMVMETIAKVLTNLGATDINGLLEEELVDGILYAFQEQTSDDEVTVIFHGFGAVINALGMKVKPYLPVIIVSIKWRKFNGSENVKQQATDLVSRIEVVVRQCQGEHLLEGL
ncbi:splicing factor 3B subunit 1-like [Macadamia integrifolia]|uniref:splicing factor 3B subunit 1-like n=1 Tax=Macadamia integrifolia TaxID=60698 RepID=UPI001C4E4B53|nr:splicing factor 3B subunit 1-like [Macadamia integrifolia]